tara:strand:+ start:670 stop:1182 length:513 start_codon:yes stop_codon:yes gene_type:complete
MDTIETVMSYLVDMRERGDDRAKELFQALADMPEPEFEAPEGYHTTKVFTTVDCDHGPCIGHTFADGWVMYTYTEDLARVSFHHPDVSVHNPDVSFHHPYEEYDAQAELDALKSYDVEIKATVRKTITVEAGDEKSAVEQAHEMFAVANDGDPEHYEQDTLSVEETAHGV